MLEPTIFIPLIGATGEKFPEFGGLSEVFCHGLFHGYFRNKSSPSETVIRKYCSGALPIPQKIVRYYSGNDGLARTYSDMQHLLGASTSIQRLLDIQWEVYLWIKYQPIPPDIIDSINAYYLDWDATYDDIVMYITLALNYAVTQL